MEFLKKNDPDEYEKRVRFNEEINRFKIENPEASVMEMFKRSKLITEKFEELRDNYPDASIEEIFEKIRDLDL